MAITFKVFGQLILGLVYVGAVHWLLYLLTATSVFNLARLRYSNDFVKEEPDATKPWARRVGIGFSVVVVPLATGIGLRELVQNAGATPNVQGIVLLMPPILAVWCTREGMKRYREMRIDPTRSSSQTEMLGPYYTHLINNTMLMIANRQAASMYWVSTTITTIFMTFESPTLQVLIKEALPGEVNPDFWQAVLGAIAFVSCLKMGAKIRQATHAQVCFLETYCLLYRRRQMHDTTQLRFRTGARASRWRSPEHRTGMELAAILERCVAGTQRRLEAGDAERVGNTYYRLATLLRRAAIRSKDSRAASDHFDGLIAVSFTLLFEGNPVTAAQTFEHVVADEPVPTPPAASRFRALLSNLGDNLERHEKTVRNLRFLVVLVALIVTGQFGRLVEVFTK